MEIPVNDNKRDYKSEIAQQIMNLLNSEGEAWLYKSDRTLGSTDQYIEVAKEFVKKGYYAKVNYFVESWKGVQCIAVSKTPLEAANARLVYSEIL